MKQIYLIGTLVVLILATACGPTQPEAEPTLPAEETPVVEEEPASRPTVTPRSAETDPNGAAYPGAADPAPPVLPADGYPAPAFVQPYDPYPAADYVWVIVPAGEQCAESRTYESEQDALAILLSNDIFIRAFETVNMVVCQACGCPTSEQYRAEILAADLANVEALGWMLIETE